MKQLEIPPLHGVVVVDLTRVLAGPYCTMLLGDLGAEVIKVEMPGSGDDSRQIGPFVDTDAGPVSAYFFSVNRNKESIALNLKVESDKRIFENLLTSADVLVENFTPGTMDRLGYSWETLHQLFPRLIFASISGFGQTGPYRDYPAYDLVVQAMGGIWSLTGEEGGRPTRVGISIGDLAAGLFGAIGVQAALLGRHSTGVGRRVDIAMLDCQVALLENALARFQVTGNVPRPIGTRHPSIAPFGLYETADGKIVLVAGNDIMFQRLCDALDAPELAKDMRFSSNASRCEFHVPLRQSLEHALASGTVAHWVDHLRSAGIACGPLSDVADLFRDGQIAARGMLVDLPVGEYAVLKVAGNPIKLDTPLPPFRPAPLLDADRQQILDRFAGR